MADSFLKRINDGDAGQLLALAANFSGTIGGIVAFISLFQESDTDKILGAINQLRQDIERDFAQLGDLIRQQTQIVVDTVNRDTMALALSRSDIASDRIQDFLANNDSQALEDAKTESIGGVRFFTELGLTSPDLSFFMPGLIKAGTIRLFVIASEPLSLREPRPVVVNDVTLMVGFLASMIDSIKRTVDAAHYVKQISHSQACSALPQSPVPLGAPHRTVFVVDGYSHYEINPPGDDVLLEFFDAQQGNPPCEQPSGLEGEARSAAVQARSQGVTDELAFLGVPGFEQVLQSWRNLLAA